MEILAKRDGKGRIEEETLYRACKCHRCGVQQSGIVDAQKAFENFQARNLIRGGYVT